MKLNDKNGLMKRIIKIIILLLISTVLIILLMTLIAPKPPIKEFKAYHKLLKNSYPIYIYDKESYINADYFRNKAYEEWQKQNIKFFLIRDYTDTERMIIMAISILEEAHEKINNTLDLKSDT